MQKLEGVIKKKTGGRNAVLSGISVGAVSVTGEFEYRHVAGPLSVSPGSQPLKDDDVFWIASCTKLITTICMLQCIERGIFTLDQDITTVLPEWNNPDILTGFDEQTGEPILKKAKNKITIRHLLTHSAGMGALAGTQSIIAEYKKWIGAPARSAETTVEEWALCPLIYEPGESWQYSNGIDWAGKMIERVTKESLSAYMLNHIFKPLGMTTTTFHQSEIIDRLVPTTERPATDLKISNIPNGTSKKLMPGTSVWPDGMKDNYGGAGLYSTVNDYMKVLMSIMRNDEVLLKRESVEEMFRPHLTPKSHAALNKHFCTNKDSSPFYASCSGNPIFFVNENDPKAQVETDWGLGGLLLMEDIENGRKKGTLSWSGLPNLYWWIDPATGVCGMYATQMMPMGDAECAKMNSDFERAVYDELELVRGFLRS